MSKKTIVHECTLIAQSVQDAAEKALNADKTAISRWDTFKAVAGEHGISWEHAVSPNTKNSLHKPDDPTFLVDQGGDRIVSTFGEVYDDMLNMAFNFLPAAQRKSLDTPTKALDDAGKEAKRYARQQQGNIMGKFVDHLKPKEAKKKGAHRNKSVAVRISESLTQAKKWVQADDEPNYDPLAVIRGIDAAQTALHDAIPKDVETDK